MPETSLSGRSTLTALSVLRSKSAPTVARILHTQKHQGLRFTFSSHRVALAEASVYTGSCEKLEVLIFT